VSLCSNLTAPTQFSVVLSTMATSEQKKRRVGGRTSLEFQDVTFSSRETSMEVDNAGDALPQMARNSGEGDLVESLVALLGCIQGDNKRMTEDNARLNEIAKKDQLVHNGLVARIKSLDGSVTNLTMQNGNLVTDSKQARTQFDDQLRLQKTSSDRDSEEKIKFAEVQMKDVFRQIAGQQIEAQKSAEAALLSQLEDAKDQLASMSDQLHASYADVSVW
jgi:preprotein translocase subunit YajC